MNQTNSHSVWIDDRETIASFSENLLNTYLVSFPRTGSHWLRMLMELYFDRPSLTRAFYYFEKKNYLTLHTHDMELDVQRRNVIYLYRNPVETIHSQIAYHGENTECTENVRRWTHLYAKHLQKWLCEERFTCLKTIVNYRELKVNVNIAFEKICSHFQFPFDPVKLQSAQNRVTKDEVKSKTGHDPQVINSGPSYEVSKRIFNDRFGQCISDQILSVEPKLSPFLIEESNSCSIRK